MRKPTTSTRKVLMQKTCTRKPAHPEATHPEGPDAPMPLPEVKAEPSAALEPAHLPEPLVLAPIPEARLLVADSGDEIPAGRVQFASAEEIEPATIQLIAHEQPAAETASETKPAVETAGFCEISDSCTQGKVIQYVPDGRGTNPLSRLCQRSGDEGWQYCDTEEEACDCPICRFKHHCKCCCTWPYYSFCHCLYDDHTTNSYAGGSRVWGRPLPEQIPPDATSATKRSILNTRVGTWRREIPLAGHYGMGYPIDPHYFDQRDGRIYAAQGYGHPVAVPLAPNVEYTYNYGWGLPSSRLTPISRMPKPANAGFPGAYPLGMPLQ